MSDFVELIDGDGHTIGWARSVSPEYDRGDRTVVQLDEYTPKTSPTSWRASELRS